MTTRGPMHRRVETPWGPKYRGVKTPWYPRYRGVETPRCPMYRGVAKPDPLKIQNSPKYQGVETPRCPMYQGVKTLQYFVSQNSPVSYVPGSRFLFLWTFKPMLQPLKQHSFKKLFNINIYHTNTVQTCMKIFPITRFLWRLPGVPSTGESF